MKELARVKATKGLSLSKSKHGTAGKYMVLLGGGALVVPIVAALIPFVGTILLASVLVGLGILFWE